MNQIFGVILIIVSFWEFYSVCRLFINTKKHATESTSRFLPLALFSGFFFGIIMLGSGIAFILNQY